jgi:DNA-binding CsgD family transcriptional regulator
MGAGQAATTSLVGREAELALLGSAVSDARNGRFACVLVSGDAGVGKTSLVQSALSSLAAESVLWCSCPPMRSLLVPLLSLTAGVDRWVEITGRPRPFPTHRAVADLPRAVETWIEDTARAGAVALVLDDVHWADSDTLDVLMYLLTGRVERRLVLMATRRQGAAWQSPRLATWWADATRLPHVRTLHLGPLDRHDTAHQMAALLGAQPRQSLVDDVYRRSQGNTYFTRLLVTGVDPDADRVSPGLPSTVREAVAVTWQSASSPALALISALAVAGRPQPAARLTALLELEHPGSNTISVLRECVTAGVLKPADDGRYWFRHPLQSETLYAALLPEERSQWHRRLATLLEESRTTHPDTSAGDHAQLAEHWEAAGDPERAWQAMLTAADLASAESRHAMALQLLHRASRLGPLAGDDQPADGALWRRIRAAANAAGEQDAELAAVEMLLNGTEPHPDPMTRAELLVRRLQLWDVTGRQFVAPEQADEAVRLTESQPVSAGHALAMSQLALAQGWQGLDEASATAEAALFLARESGSARARSYALTARIMSRMIAGDGPLPSDPSEAQEAALESGDYWAFVCALIWTANSLDCPANPAVIELLQRGREKMIAGGAPHAYVAHIAAVEASGLAITGHWQDAQNRLRLVLGRNPGPMADITARLTAALLLNWQGQPSQAASHLVRAEEIVADGSSYKSLEFDVVRAEIAIAAGDLDTAIAAVRVGISQTPPPTLCERLLPLAARALADQVQSRRDRRQDPEPAVERLDTFHQDNPRIVRDFGPGVVYQRQVSALQTLYDAEVLRGRNGPDQADAWTAAAEQLDHALLPWDSAYAWWRAAQTSAITSTKRDAAHAARNAHRLAAPLAAQPLLKQIEALATRTRIDLDPPVVPPTGPIQLGLPDLTPREAEVLTLIVAGLTYAEIARALVVGEKTVSTHVSHLLQKTATRNRGELAELARRLSGKP